MPPLAIDARRSRSRRRPRVPAAAVHARPPSRCTRPGCRTWSVARTGRSTRRSRSRVTGRLGKVGRLAQRQPHLLPRHDRRNEEVDPQRVGVMEVDRVAVLRRGSPSRCRCSTRTIARACGRAARSQAASPGSRSSCRSPDPATRGCRCRARARSSRRTRRTDSSCHSMRVSRSMLCVQHVSIVLAEPRCFANSASGKKCSLSPCPPVTNERRSTTVCQKKRAARRYRSSPRQLGKPLEADDLRDLRVGVQPVERVARLGQRREQRLVAEAARQRRGTSSRPSAPRRPRAPRSCRRARCAACAASARRSSARSRWPSIRRASVRTSSAAALPA